ncbi:MAG: LCP family protein [Coriobacteriaceae bacterium]|jgi:LCP family protein required for cell wall assembly|nr:LCP family protein [Coriobacteriaceae bacterium]
MNNVTVGTHVPGRPLEDGIRSGGEPPEGVSAASGVTPMPQDMFSSARRTERARKGVVDHLTPETESGETSSEAERRTNRPTFAQTQQRRIRIRGIAIAVAALALVAAVAAGAGAFAYAGSVSDKMSLGDSNAREALVAAAAGEPAYLLFAAEFFEPGRDYNGPSLLMLMRVDKDAGQITLLSIPANLQVFLSDGAYHRLSEAQVVGGDAELIAAVSEFVEVPIAHFVKTDREGFVALVDSLGGLSVDVTDEVDDPQAGAIYIPAGLRTLSGEEALILSRATNFLSGDTVRSKNQSRVAVALGQRLLEKSWLELAVALDGIAENISTDLGAVDFMTLVKAFPGTSPESVYTGQVPGYFETSTFSGIRYFIPGVTAWAQVQEAFVAGEPPGTAETDLTGIDPASFSILIRNGAGVTGSARQMADVLEAQGYRIEDIGNADVYVYKETLVVYHSKDFAPAAEAVVHSLGMGRAIASNGFYAFDTDILVVLGEDWKPIR